MQVSFRPTPRTPANLHQIVEWAFGKRMTPQERLRKHQRALEKTQRELDRERVKLENQEKKLIVEIKKSAKNEFEIELALDCLPESVVILVEVLSTGVEELPSVDLAPVLEIHSLTILSPFGSFCGDRLLIQLSKPAESVNGSAQSLFEAEGSLINSQLGDFPLKHAFSASALQ